MHGLCFVDTDSLYISQLRTYQHLRGADSSIRVDKPFLGVSLTLGHRSDLGIQAVVSSPDLANLGPIEIPRFGF